jgi:histidinol dehydrogenase
MNAAAGETAVTGDSVRGPVVLDWNAMSAPARDAALARPAQSATGAVEADVRGIVSAVRARGDAALRQLTERYDNVRLDELSVTPAEFATARQSLEANQIEALERAIDNVGRFHALQPEAPGMLTMPGVHCERIIRPIDPVGLYVPGGSAPLPSTVVMLGVPARIAGCRRRVLCTPPRPDGTVAASVLVAAELCGITELYKVGGAQAIGALAYGTESVPKVHKIFGPGNAWVTAAKQLVASDASGAASDLPAGPSEVMVIADDSAQAAFVAADLLAQAEHGADSQAILVTTSGSLARAVAAAVREQMAELSRRAILALSIATSRCIIVRDRATALEIANAYAPEHLILAVREPRRWLAEVHNAGSVFLGEWSPESLGDYCSGTNHVLPTYGYARAYSGLSTADFVKRISVQEISPAGLRVLGPTAITLARLEGLDAHAAAVALRLESAEA